MFHDSLPRFGAAALAAALSLSAFSAELQFSAFDIGAVQIGGSGSGVDSAELTSLRRELQDAIAGEATSRATNDSALSAALAEEIGSREDGDTWLYDQMRRRVEYEVYEEREVVTTNETSGVVETNVVIALTGDSLAKESDVDAVSSNLATHVATKSGNPHGVTASDVGVGLTNGTIYVDGETITPLTEHQSLAGYLTKDTLAAAETDPSTGLTNGTAYVRGKKVVSAETDPNFAAWKDGTSIAAGEYATAAESGVAVGATAAAAESGVAVGANAAAGLVGTPTPQPDAVAIGSGAWGIGEGSTAIGHNAYTPLANTMGVPYAPSNFYLDAIYNQTNFPGKSLQSYLDERVEWCSLTNEVNALARALVKAKLESLDAQKSSIGEMITALQSIYEETK